MIIYVAVLTSLLVFLVLALVYLADVFEREPLGLIQNVFLAGLGCQLVLLLAGHRLAAVDAWTGGLTLVTLATLAVVLPLLLAGEKEVDERFDGIVYAVAFATGAAAAVHLFNLPGAVAAFPERVVLQGAAPGFRDLLLLAAAPGPRGALADLAALILVAALAGAVLGTLALQGRPLAWRIGGTLAAALLLGGLDLAAGGGWAARLALAAAAVAVAVALKRRSVYRRRPPREERDVFLDVLKTGLMIFGAIVLALALLMSATDRWDPAPGGPQARGAGLP